MGNCEDGVDRQITHRKEITMTPEKIGFILALKFLSMAVFIALIVLASGNNNQWTIPGGNAPLF